MRYALLYWVCLGVAGAGALVHSVPAVLVGPGGGLAAMVALGGVFMLRSALAGLRDPDGSVAPTEPGVRLYMAVAAAALSVGAAAFGAL